MTLFLEFWSNVVVSKLVMFYAFNILLQFCEFCCLSLVWSAMSVGASNSSRSSPWESPARNQSAFASSAGAAAFAGGNGGMEDEFDLLSTSRSKSPANTHHPPPSQQQQQPLVHHSTSSIPHPISGRLLLMTDLTLS